MTKTCARPHGREDHHDLYPCLEPWRERSPKSRGRTSHPPTFWTVRTESCRSAIMGLCWSVLVSTGYGPQDLDKCWKTEKNCHIYFIGTVETGYGRSVYLMVSVHKIMEGVMQKRIGVLLLGAIASTTLANDGHDRLMTMSASERTKALGGVLNASGEACTPTMSFFQGFDKDKAAYWNVACSNGKAFNVQIADDKTGSTRILDCSILKMIGSEHSCPN